MSVAGTQTDTEGNHPGVHAILAVEGEWYVSAAGTTTYELSLFISHEFDAIQRHSLSCSNVGDVLIIFEIERLFNELTTSTLSSQPCVLIPIAIIGLPIVDLIPLDDDCLEPAIISLIESHMVHLSEFVMIVMPRYQKALKVSGLLSVMIDRPLGLCLLNVTLIL